MKHISINKNDSTFENKCTYESLSRKIKALGASFKRNRANTFSLLFLSGCLLFSTSNLYKTGRDLIGAVDYYATVLQDDSNIATQNNESIKALNDEGILATGIALATEEPSYHFKDHNLYDSDENIVTLDDSTEPLFFIRCNLDEETLTNIHLANSKASLIAVDYSPIDKNFIDYLPNTIEYISLNKCSFITNLNGLGKRCPNIKELSINSAAGLTDLSFVYELPNLSVLYLSESAYVTEELLEYCNEHNIETNLTEQDLKTSQEIDRIISEIIKPDMSDKEKIQAVCLYVLDNVTYDIHQSIESNRAPLTCILEDGKGVCASYAYFTNVLLNKAGIKSFNMSNGSHAWNMVSLDSKYYYIDTTNMDNSKFYNFLLKTLNITKYYMIDTSNTFITAMSAPDDDKTAIPLSLIKDIENGRSNKDLFEKYGGQIGNVGILIGSIISGLSIALIPKFICDIKDEGIDLYYYLKKGYEIELEKQSRTL